jgi:hypothetical protein
MTAMTPQIGAVAAVMDEIDQCRNPMPCDLCRQRMQSILDIGATAERNRNASMRLQCQPCGWAALLDQAWHWAWLFASALVISGPPR